MSAFDVIAHTLLQTSIGISIGIASDMVFKSPKNDIKSCTLFAESLLQISSTTIGAYVLLSSENFQTDPFGGLVLAYVMYHSQETLNARLAMIGQRLKRVSLW